MDENLLVGCTFFQYSVIHLLSNEFYVINVSEQKSPIVDLCSLYTVYKLSMLWKLWWCCLVKRLWKHGIYPGQDRLPPFWISEDCTVMLFGVPEWLRLCQVNLIFGLNMKFVNWNAPENCKQDFSSKYTEWIMSPSVTTNNENYFRKWHIFNWDSLIVEINSAHLQILGWGYFCINKVWGEVGGTFDYRSRTTWGNAAKSKFLFPALKQGCQWPTQNPGPSQRLEPRNVFCSPHPPCFLFGCLFLFFMPMLINV